MAHDLSRDSQQDDDDDDERYGQCNFVSTLSVEGASKGGRFVNVLNTGQLGDGDEDLRTACILLLVDHLQSKGEVVLLDSHSSRVTARNDKATWILQSAETDNTPCK